MPSNAEDTTTIHLRGKQTAWAIAENHHVLTAARKQSTTTIIDSREKDHQTVRF